MIIDQNMYNAMQIYKAKNRESEMIFTVSDMKEGFEKDFFDSIHIFDD